MINHGRPSISAEQLYARISSEDILRRYVGIEFVPSLIHSPLRRDEQKSFSLFYLDDGVTVLFRDHASGLSGDVMTLLALMWGCSRVDAIHRVWNECGCGSREIITVKPRPPEPTEIQIKIRKAEQRDIDYWASYGVTAKRLRWAGIVPVSHFVLVCGKSCRIYKAHDLAYAFTSMHGIKLYQPHSTMKWRSSMKKDHVFLYDKLPSFGDTVVVCSSMKDALCLWTQLDIPAIAPQSEGTSLPPKMVKELKERFRHRYILYDNDKAGIGYAQEAAKETGFENIVLPQFDGGKDLSDLYKATGDKERFKQQIITLIHHGI